MEKEIVEMMCKKYEKKEIVIQIMIAKAKELGYNKKDSFKVIDEFYKK